MNDPRSALERLIGALEDLHTAASATKDPDAPSVIEAGQRLADAYVIYDDAIFTSYGVELPFDLYDDDDVDDDDDDDDDDDFDDLDYDDDEDDEDDLDDDDLDYDDDDDDDEDDDDDDDILDIDEDDLEPLDD